MLRSGDAKSHATALTSASSRNEYKHKLGDQSVCVVQLVWGVLGATCLAAYPLLLCYRE